MDGAELLESLFDSKIISIISLLLHNKEKQFYLREISKETKVPLATTYRIIKKLVALKIAKQVQISRFKLYQIESNEQASFLSSMIKEKKKALAEFVNRAKVMREVNVIILHGEETETKANLLLIGEDIEIDKIKALTAEIKEKYEFTVSYMSLTSAQFEQMSSIGLLPRQKRILFER